MSGPIAPGDLVYVVGNPLDLLCEHVNRYLGLPLKVYRVLPSANLICPDCGRAWHGVSVAIMDEKSWLALRVSWLKKMEPPAVDKTIENEREHGMEMI